MQLGVPDLKVMRTTPSVLLGTVPPFEGDVQGHQTALYCVLFLTIVGNVVYHTRRLLYRVKCSVRGPLVA